MTRDDLANHKLHVAEQYVSKEGHRQAAEQIMAAISSVRSDIGAVRDRLDRMFDRAGER